MIRILTLKDSAEIKRIKERGRNLNETAESVKPILEGVRNEGDKAVRYYTEKFDKVRLSDVKVSGKEIKQAYEKVSKGIIEAIKISAENVRKYHEMQMPKEWMKEISKGVRAGQLVRPLDSVGCYVPGGNYPLVSTVIMTVIPANVAGVKEIVVCSPPEIDPAILVAADICGATSIYKVGGAQAIAAMAYGTQSIRKVNKIVGPGNIYVTAAKKMVYGDAGIDFIAGPSEIMIIADDGCKAEFIAADMLSQVEHDVLASALLVTPSEKLCKEVEKEIEKQLGELPTKQIAGKAIKDYSAIILVRDIDEAFDFANEFAPEHLEIMMQDESLLKKVRNAGAVFLGNYSVEAAGDYCAGPNHVLPTGQFAKARAGLSVLDYVKMPTVQVLTREGLARLSSAISALSQVEGLEAHKRSVEIRK